MISVDDVQKKFGSVVAVGGVSFDARDGQITALLGPNGAGKTTTLRMITALLTADKGRVTIDGIDVKVDPAGAHRRLGALPHAHGLYPRLTPREHVAYFGKLHGLDDDAIKVRCAELFQILDMGEFQDRRAEGFSQGQKLKVALARALVHAPQNLVLDEPTAGLDVKGIRAMRGFLLQQKQQGRCVVFSTHVMQEVAALADHVVIVAHGKVTAAGSLDQLRAATGKTDLEEAFIAAVGDDEGLQ
ncbi:MAG: ATP-binding cassette domain-containing protein [Deltaproteobacteria bacterium]|nr:ATP-binding cassette domain-containing protein [Deltaproteobacteria bacterium]